MLITGGSLEATYGYGNASGPEAWGYDSEAEARAAAPGGDATVGEVCADCNEWVWSCTHAEEFSAAG